MPVLSHLQPLVTVQNVRALPSRGTMPNSTLRALADRKLQEVNPHRSFILVAGVVPGLTYDKARDLTRMRLV